MLVLVLALVLVLVLVLLLLPFLLLLLLLLPPACTLFPGADPPPPRRNQFGDSSAALFMSIAQQAPDLRTDFQPYEVDGKALIARA